MTSIHFYHLNEPYGDFSNFAPYPIQIDGQTWPTSEHYFQSQKFADPDRVAAIRQATSARQAADMGRDRAFPLRDDWQTVRDGIMHRAVLAKFLQHESLRELLLETGDRPLVEHTANDAYWGDGGDGQGENKLGQILQIVRDQLRQNLSLESVTIAQVPIARDAAFGLVPICISPEGDRHYLLIQHQAGHWAFPKGHAEPGETALATARREFTEETGIQAVFPFAKPQFREYYDFAKSNTKTGQNLNKHIYKTVVYFPAIVCQRTATIQIEEVQDYAWLSYSQARDRITFVANRSVIDAAETFFNDLSTLSD